MANTPHARAAAKAAIDAYARALDGVGMAEHGNEPNTLLADLLADLMHLSDVEPITDDDSEGFNFDAALATATMNYSAEAGERATAAEAPSKARTDQNNLGDALHLVRQHCPTAVAVHLATSDQDRYGFILTGVEYADGTRADQDWSDDGPLNPLPGDVADQVNDLLSDIDWNGVVGEDKHGYVEIEIPGATA